MLAPWKNTQNKKANLAEDWLLKFAGSEKQWIRHIGLVRRAELGRYFITDENPDLQGQRLILAKYLTLSS